MNKRRTAHESKYIHINKEIFIPISLTIGLIASFIISIILAIPLANEYPIQANLLMILIVIPMTIISLRWLTHER